MLFGTIAALSIALVGAAGASLATADSAVADAAENRHGALIRSLLDDGIRVDAAQVDGMTALHWAVHHDDAASAELLVRSGANVNVTNRYGIAPLSLACTNGNAAVVKLLLDAGANPNTTLRGGETALMTASRTGSLDAVTALLANGANPNAREQRGQTALMWAAAEGHALVVQTLIDAEADFRAGLESGFTPVFFAVREGHGDVVQSLLEAGIDVNETLHRSAGTSYRLAKDGTSPLLLAIRNGHFELALALVEAGADPNDERSGLTPLHRLSLVRKPDASDLGDPAPRGSGNMTSLQFARALVAFGADVNAQLASGRMQGVSPFLLAADRADASYMRLLLELGADPFLRNAANSTPLMAAAGLGTNAPIEEAGTEPEALQAVELLLSLGANVNAVDDNGETAMHGAAYGSFPSIVWLLADSNADPDIWRKPNKRGWTPLHIAEGYRPGNFKPAPATIEALNRIMLVAGVPTDGPRPRHVGAYETARLAAQKKASQQP
ncbi:MAG: ankyrin repeat domain-containing protein [Gammaproteobacteria bacterium]|nr:ankyrin repeat domain-containing protein [Gammaproteobacteria bacterium]